MKLGAFRLTPLCSIVPSFLMTSFPLLLFHVAVTEGESIAAPPVKVNSVPFLLS